jgi:hypothetical protein
MAGVLTCRCGAKRWQGSRDMMTSWTSAAAANEQRSAKLVLHVARVYVTASQ